MPEYGTRGMRPVAEAGELPQLKQYGATSARRKIYEYTSGDEISLFCIAMSSISLLKSDGLVSGAGVQVNFNPISNSILESFKLPDRAYETVDGKNIKSDLILNQCSYVRSFRCF